MEKRLQYEKLKFTDWSKHMVLNQRQLSKLIDEKVLRAKIYSDATLKVKKKLAE